MLEFLDQEWTHANFLYLICSFPALHAANSLSLIDFNKGFLLSMLFENMLVVLFVCFCFSLINTEKKPKNFSWPTNQGVV